MQSQSTEPTVARSSKFDAPEFLLYMVVSFMLWSIGFVDLLAHTTTDMDRAVFGLYTPAILAVLAAYLGLLGVWAAFLFAPGSHHLAAGLVRFVQARAWLGLLILAGFAALSWSFFNVARWEEFPGLRAALFFWMLMTGGVILLANWGAEGRGQNWRKVVLIPLVALLVVEAGLQVLAYAGRLPGTVYINNGIMAPYGRIYQNREGFANDTTNNYGWYYPDFDLSADETVLLLGDTYIQSLQVGPEEHLGRQLQARLAGSAAGTEEESPAAHEVIALGMPGFGPGLYLSDTRLVDTVESFAPDQVIVFFHLSDDLQVAATPADDALFFQLNDQGMAEIHPAANRNYHDLKHFILPGYNNGTDPLATLASHTLTDKVLGLQTAYAESAAPAGPMDFPATQGVILRRVQQDDFYSDIKQVGLVSTPGAANFAFDPAQSDAAQKSMAIAQALLGEAHAYLASQGVTLRVVTIPAFPPAFFDQESSTWTAELGGADLFLPERQLQAFAQEQGIPFLAMGNYLQESGAGVDDIRALFLDQGQGHFTPAGHAFFAEAVHACFYTGAMDDPALCTPR